MKKATEQKLKSKSPTPTSPVPKAKAEKKKYPSIVGRAAFIREQHDAGNTLEHIVTSWAKKSGEFDGPGLQNGLKKIIKKYDASKVKAAKKAVAKAAKKEDA